MRIALLAPTLLASGYSLAFPGSPKGCRCLSTDACWPQSSDFEQLTSQLSQPLLQPVPPESACYPVSTPSGNCSQVVQNVANGNWRSDQPGIMQASNWETFVLKNGSISACYLNTSLGAPCEQGSVPVAGVDARQASDVQAAVKFAKDRDLRLVVKNTGHDFLGRSTARGAFLLWTHHMKVISYNDSFVPEGAPASEKYQALTLGAGVQWHEAYDAAQANGRVIVGGLSARGSVGAAGGWVLGGGHSALAPAYGLGVDNVVQMTVVTADGRHLTTSIHSNSDLFWALRGGGGGTYGVLTSVTYRTFPSISATASFFTATTNNPNGAKKLMSEFIRINPTLADAGWGGYGFFSADAFITFMIAPNVSMDQANATWFPFFEFANTLAAEGVTVTGNNTVPYDDFYSWYQQFFNRDGQVGTSEEIASRLLSRDVLERNHDKVAQAILDMGGIAWHLVAGGAVSKVDPDSTGLNPAWRTAVAHLVTGENWQEGASASEIQEARNRLKNSTRALEAMEPGSGSYFNEASLWEENPQRTFFGSHYEKLKSIKQKYDPSGLFVVAEGVGSEDWDTSLNCRR